MTVDISRCPGVGAGPVATGVATGTPGGRAAYPARGAAGWRDRWRAGRRRRR